MGRPCSFVSHHDERDRWDVARARAAPDLDDLIQSYSWWSEETSSFHTRRELASTSGVLHINLGADLEIVDASGDTHRIRAGDGFVGGMARRTSLSRSTGAMEGVHVHMPLSAMSRLLGCSMAALANRVVKLADVAGDAGRALGGRLVDARALEARWTLVDDFLRSGMQRAAERDRELSYLLAQLARGRRVEETALALGWSRKRLARRFHDATGLLPREFAALARFERLTRALEADPNAPLAGAAAAAGYADQPHMTREVRRFASMTPGELLSRLIPGGAGVRD